MAKPRAQRRSSVLRPQQSSPSFVSTTPHGLSSDKALLPLGALMLAASVGAMAQTTTPEKTLAPVVVKERAEAPDGKASVRATETTIGKGK